MISTYEQEIETFYAPKAPEYGPPSNLEDGRVETAEDEYLDMQDDIADEDDINSFNALDIPLEPDQKYDRHY